MRWLFRPSILVAISVALALGAAALFYFTGNSDGRPEPKPVRAGDREIVFLYPATSASTWERFVTAITTSVQMLHQDWPELEATPDKNTFPPQTTAVPELVVSLGKSHGRLVFRWYKLTGSQKTGDWVEALLHRRPPPLAIVGGSSSDGARELARQLARATEPLPEASRPLLLLTTATADRVEETASATADASADAGNPPSVELHRLYPGRTFRFCFSNRQMAEAVTQFIWSQDDLRPDADPVYTVSWEDDSYSRDLTAGFARALRQPAAQAAARDWAWLAGASATGAFTISREAPGSSQFRLGESAPQTVPWSTGSFDRPNRHEIDAAGWLIEEVRRRPTQRRPLLVLAGQSQPSRRFLRALVRRDEEDARRFIVATGDTLAFNTIYRDRNVAWPIQELPFSLVFFCHRNPINAEAARLAGEGSGHSADSGTEDLILFQDIATALLHSARKDGPSGNAGALNQRLHAMRFDRGKIGLDANGQPLFTADGNRQSGTGEHIVCLRPRFEGPQVLPEATIHVYGWRRDELLNRRWQELAGSPQRVRYDEPTRGGNGHHAGD